MKILKEAKDQLPSSFVTDKISKLWEEIGYIKEEQKAIKQTFSGTDKVIEILRELEDSYLIAVSRLQAFASNKNMVVLPEADGKAIKEGLEEDAPAAVILQNFAAKLDRDDAPALAPAAPKAPAVKPTVTAVSDTDLDAETDRLLADDTEPSVSAAPVQENSNKDNFEYFCDFDDPEPDDEAEADLQDARAQLA